MRGQFARTIARAKQYLGNAFSRRVKRYVLHLLGLVVLLLVYMKWAAVLTNRYSSSHGRTRTDDGGGAAAGGPSVAVVIVLKKPSEIAKFKLAISTQRCYAGLQGYPFHLLYMEHRDDDPSQSEWERAMITKCLADRFKQEHTLDAWGGQLMFDRLCGLAELMAAHPEYDYVLFLDADIGVINPERRIEEFIDVEREANLIFYERDINNEIMSGAFLAKNHEQTRQFLYYWYNYTWELARRTNQSHDTYAFTAPFNREQGTIHEVFMEMFADPVEKETCDLIFYEPRIGRYDTTVFPLFIACQRYFLYKHIAKMGADGSYYYYNETFGLIQILGKFKSFVRDGTYGLWRWNDKIDFMLHEWKEVRKVSEWARQIVGEEPFDSGECSTWGSKEEVIQRYWRDRTRLMVDEEELLTLFKETKERYHSDYKEYVKEAFEKVRKMNPPAGVSRILESVGEDDLSAN